MSERTAVPADPQVRAPVSPALLTDRYELTMLSSWVEDGRAEHRAVWECFARTLPRGRRYGVAAGLGRLLPLLRDFRFDADEVRYLRDVGAVSERCAGYLREWRFTGDVDAYREGDLYFPYSPVLTVSGTLGDVVLETLLLSVLNFDSAVASAAARMVVAAGGRSLIEMGSRRTHEAAAVAAARAAYVAGFAATSNLAAGLQWGVPTTGTAAHAFTLSYPREADAFASQLRALGTGTTLLVDTYDVEQGVRTAVAAAGPTLGAVRVDSGDLAAEARRVRALLDSLGATSTRIVVTSDLDEDVIASLRDAPVDAYGVGTRVVTGSTGGPHVNMVMKLVAVADSADPAAPLRPVAKTSRGKANPAGRKLAFREYDGDGHVRDEVLVPWSAPMPDHAGSLRSVPVVRGGEIVHAPGLDEVREFHAGARATLPAGALDLAPAETPYLTATMRRPDV